MLAKVLDDEQELVELVHVHTQIERSSQVLDRADYLAHEVLKLEEPTNLRLSKSGQQAKTNLLLKLVRVEANDCVAEKIPVFVLYVRMVVYNAEFHVTRCGSF